MLNKMMKVFYKLMLVILIICCGNTMKSFAQDFLQKKISIAVSNVPLYEVLNSIEKQGGFSFSYNSSLFKADSIVSIHAKNQRVSAVLDQLLGRQFKYKEHNKHLIISPNASQNNLQISGMVIDKTTGAPVPYATVYSRAQLIAAMTDEGGHFGLTLKKRGEDDSISVSRVSYADTTISLSPEQIKNIQIKLSVIDKPLDSVFVTMMAQRDWLARTLLSYKQAVNSLNLNNFFVKQPVQFSILPGLGSRGKMSSQVVNKFSFNILGGYNGGVDGVEIGGLYNINNKDARYVQVAGLFNLVGGHSEGVQVGGLFNKALSAEGVQVGGLFNKTQSARGVQVGGLLNKTKSIDGFQVAGLHNNTSNARGMQVGGLYNKTDTMNGFQIAGIVNRNRKFKGLQIAPVNISDTLEGYSIGLINISKNGYHKASLSMNEMGMGMLSFKSGNPELYSMVIGGTRFDSHQRAYSFGFGLGSDIPVLKSPVFINPELMSLYFYNGNWQKSNISGRLQLNFKYKISRSVAIYAGPAFTALYSKSGTVPGNYKEDISNGMHIIKLSNRVNGWFGWNVGIDLF